MRKWLQALPEPEEMPAEVEAGVEVEVGRTRTIKG